MKNTEVEPATEKVERNCITNAHARTGERSTENANQRMVTFVGIRRHENAFVLLIAHVVQCGVGKNAKQHGTVTLNEGLMMTKRAGSNNLKISHQAFGSPYMGHSPERAEMRFRELPEVWVIT